MLALMQQDQAPATVSQHKCFPQISVYLLCCEWHQTLLALQKVKEKQNYFSWFAQLPRSVQF